MRFQTVVTATCAVGLLGSATADVIIASTSFEEVPLFSGIQYVDLGDPLIDHQLFNNVDEPFVEFISTGSEMGFTAFYFNTRDSVGLTDGDWVGVTDFVGTVGAYTDGLNGYQLADADGMMQVVFDTIDISGATDPFVLLDYFIRDTTWETDPPDSVRIYVVTNDATEIDILNTHGSDIDDLGIEGFWTEGVADLAGFTSATLIVEVDSNSGREEVYLDNVRICDGLPAGGTETVCADTFVQLRGVVNGGGFADTCGSDDIRWSHQPDSLAATVDAPIVIEFSGTFTSADGVALRFTVEDMATEAGVVLNQAIFNFTTGLFEGAVFPNIPTADTLHVVSRSTGVSDYIGPGNEVRGSVSYLRPAGVPPFWNIAIDEVTFELDQ